MLLCFLVKHSLSFLNKWIHCSNQWSRMFASSDFSVKICRQWFLFFFLSKTRFESVGDSVPYKSLFRGKNLGGWLLSGHGLSDKSEIAQFVRFSRLWNCPPTPDAYRCEAPAWILMFHYTSSSGWWAAEQNRIFSWTSGGPQRFQPALCRWI